MARIALNLIDPPTWDSRLPKTGAALKKEAEAIAALRASMDAEGQLTAIEIERADNGRYVRVFGGRRLAAASLEPAWETIEANVRESTHGNDRMVRNIVENERRSNLTTYETARACAALRDAGLKDGEIADKMGRSKTHCANSARAYTKLPPPVLEDWRNEHPAANAEFMFSLASDKEYPTPEKKQEAWDDHVREHAAKNGRADKGKERDKESASAGYPVSQKRLGHVINMLASAKASPDLDVEQRKWAKGLVDYIIQARETPPTGLPGIPPKEKKEKPAKESKAPKAEETPAAPTT